MVKSWLLRFPWLYEVVQRARDQAYFVDARKKGSFAQHGEDRILLELLRAAKATGPFVDVGCNHPVKLSNSFLLYLEGFRGLCIDPLPRFRPLYARWRPADRFVCSAIGLSNGQMPLYEFESDVLSTLDAGLAERYRQAGYKMLREATTTVSTLDAALEANRLTPPLSLLSVDIEGYELQALQSIDLDHWRPALICLEAVTADGSTNRAPAEHLLARSYVEIKNLGLNVIFKRAG